MKQNIRRLRFIKALLFIFLLGPWWKVCFAQDEDQANKTISDLKSLSIEQLANTQVTSVSIYSEPLSQTASAIQVISHEDIVKYGATRLPEALRLASNLEVVQRDAGQWSVSARGFNSSTSNKFLVLIDGRTVYSPLFSGVFWDIQDIFLEDVDRIEVISGPGGTQWGANAVNGVINVITRSPQNTQGLYFEAGGGNELKALTGLRYGGKIGSNLFFRAYGKYANRDGVANADGAELPDGFYLGQGGVEMEWDPGKDDQVLLQGDYFKSNMGAPDDKSSPIFSDGGNIMAKWHHTFSDRSDFQSHLYFDRTHRGSTGFYNDQLNTIDFDFSHQFLIGKSNRMIWGGGYRDSEDNFEPGVIVFKPQKLSLPVYNLFAQDELTVLKDKFYLIFGNKTLHNTYTGFEQQPNIRAKYLFPSGKQMVWTAVSRAVRTPSRVDRDLVIQPTFIGGPNFESEVLYAYELGYRLQPSPKTLFSLATYFNNYDKIRSVEQVNPPNPAPVEISNGFKAKGYGMELSFDFNVTDSWSMRLGYSELQLDVSAQPWSTDKSNGSAEAPDPEHYLTFRSSYRILKDLTLTGNFRYVSAIAPPMDVPAYAELDARLSWQVVQSIDVSIAGQNLLHADHAEFGALPARMLPQRNIYLRIVGRF